MKKLMTTVTMITSLSLLVVLGFVAQGMCGGIVYPTGVFPDDVENIQNAVDGGGLVVLKAKDISGNTQSFNFGVYDYSPGLPPSWLIHPRVYIDGGVKIKGETVKGQMATISGGFFPIMVGFIEDPEGKIAIRNIRFEDPGGLAIWVPRVNNGLIIQGNEIITNFYDVLGGITDAPPPVPVDPSDPTDPSVLAWSKLLWNQVGKWTAVGIQIGGPTLDYGPITGTVIVRDNYIDHEADADLPEVATRCWWETHGIGAMYTNAGKVYVKRNEILNSNANGIFLVDCIGDGYTQNNMLELGPLAAYANGDGGISAFGIVHGYGIGIGEEFPDVGGKVQILGNNIICDPANGVAPGLLGKVGIFAGGFNYMMPSHVSILNNNVSINHGLVGIDVADVDGGHIAHNRVDGSAWFGLQVGNNPAFDALHPLLTVNMIINNNDFSDFTGEFPLPVPPLWGLDTLLTPDAFDNRVIKSGIVGGAVGQNFVK